MAWMAWVACLRGLYEWHANVGDILLLFFLLLLLLLLLFLLLKCYTKERNFECLPLKQK